jgi:phosphate butyryltransferase
METNFKFLAATVKKDVEYSLIVAAAHDEPVIAAIKDATKYLKLNLFLIGDSAAIEDLLKKYQLTGKIINELDLVLISEQAVKLTKELPNPIIMKGIVDTKYVLKAVVNSATGIKNSKVLSHVGLMHFPEFNKTFLISDGGMNIAPGIDEK